MICIADSFRQRMVGEVFRAGSVIKSSTFIGCVDNLIHCKFTGGERAGFIKDSLADIGQCFDYIGAIDKNAFS